MGVKSSDVSLKYFGKLQVYFNAIFHILFISRSIPRIGLDIFDPILVMNYDPSHPEQNWHWSQGLEIKRIMAKYLPEVLLD